MSVTRPSLGVSDIMTGTQLEQLLRHCLTLDATWGTPWALHALTCLLQDILDGMCFMLSSLILILRYLFFIMQF